jgi:hypothetical protein
MRAVSLANLDENLHDMRLVIPHRAHRVISEKREKFVKLAEGRVQAALNALRKIGNLSNKRSYEYDDADVKKIVRALKEAVGEVERKFDPSGVPREKTFKL